MLFGVDTYDEGLYATGLSGDKFSSSELDIFIISGYANVI